MLTVADVRAIPLFSTLSEAELERLALAAADVRLGRGSEHYQQIRCLNATAEISLVPNDLRELEGYARWWRGAAWLADENYADAQTELTFASTLAAEVGRMRLRMDAEAALASLCAKLGQSDAARRHGVSAHKLIQAIESSLISSGLQARLHG